MATKGKGALTIFASTSTSTSKPTGSFTMPHFPTDTGIIGLPQDFL